MNVRSCTRVYVPRALRLGSLCALCAWWCWKSIEGYVLGAWWSRGMKGGLQSSSSWFSGCSPVMGNGGGGAIILSVQQNGSDPLALCLYCWTGNAAGLILLSFVSATVSLPYLLAWCVSVCQSHINIFLCASSLLTAFETIDDISWNLVWTSCHCRSLHLRTFISDPQ